MQLRILAQGSVPNSLFLTQCVTGPHKMACKSENPSNALSRVHESDGQTGDARTDHATEKFVDIGRIVRAAKTDSAYNTASEGYQYV